jgi:phosphoribosylformimino-5-aminoimidazole carboxamide ribotide isomerase
MTRFRPCIDLHAGSVKQIVGGTLTTDASALKTNFTSEHPAAYFAELYRKHDLRGGHVIMLGPGNDEAARSSLAAWPGGLQVGGGIKDGNAREWIERGAEKVEFSFLFFIPSSYWIMRRNAASVNIIKKSKDENHFSILSVSSQCISALILSRTCG